MGPGSKVAGRYLVESLAGEGGMGRVYRAVDLESNAPVAVKVLGERGHAERFAIEADALSSLDHPAIVRYVAHGLLESSEPYLVMEWLSGENLRARLRRKGLTLQESLTLARVVAETLEYIHARGVIHRDLKPANIMLPVEDVQSAKVVDFGIARLTSGRAVTATGLRIGSPFYMAPEQWSHPRLVDGRADVFALGCVLFECLTGRRAFDAEDELTAFARVVLEQAPTVRQFRPTIPTAVDACIAQLLARERAHRPTADVLRASLAALRHEFEDFELAAPAEVVVVNSPDVISTAAELASTVAVGRRAVDTRASPLLPKPQHPIVGRENELARLGGILVTSGGVVTVWGPAGIGKTRLALEGARRWALEDATRGAAFVNLRQAVDADAALRAIALTLQPASPPGGTSDEVEAIIGRTLRAKGSFALVLDGIEHVATGLGPAFERWCAAATDTRLVATSRQRAIAGMLVELGPLPVDSESSAAVRLFLQRAGASARDLESDPEAMATLLQIVRVLDGNPLAIELAAARLEMLGPRALLDRLSRRQLELLGPLSMTEALAWSWGLLGDEERLALARASVFRGSFTVQAAEAVMRVPARFPAIDLLQSLRDKSLLGSTFGRTTLEARLWMSASVRDFARGKLEELGITEETRDRHAEYFVSVSVPLARAVVSRGDVVALQALADATDEILGAYEHAVHRTLPLALEALLALDPVLATRGPSGKHREMLDEALARADASVDGHVVSRLRQARGRLLTRLGQHDDARVDLELALADARQGGDRVGEASCLLDLGILHHAMRNMDEARRLYETVARLDTDNPLVEARALGNLGAMHHDEHRFDDAYACYVEAIALFESLGDPRPIGLFLANLAMLDLDRGRVADAARRFKRAVDRLENARAPRLLAIALGSLGMLELGEGEVATAIAHHERAHVLLQEVSDPRSEALCLGRLSAALACQGSLEAAMAAMAKGERIARRDDVAKDTLRLLRAFLDAARAKEAVAENRPAEARASLDAARARIEVAREPQGTERALLDASDDARAAHRVLGPLLETLEQALAKP